LEKTVLNDGRQLGAAIQQYCMEYGQSQAPTITYVEATGLLTGTDAGFLAYLKGIGKNYKQGNLTTPIADATDSFKLKLVGAFNSKTAVFSGEGKMMGTE
jgi:hypothetical protein